MAILSYNPKFSVHYLGAALASGTVNTYVTGTTTPKTTYTTQAGDVANANPVVLDSNGQADIWLATDARYRFVVKNSAGTTLWTVDGIGDVAPSTAAGTATFATSGTKTVTFGTAQADTSYYLGLSHNSDTGETIYVTSKLTTGFTLNSNNSSSTATVDWVLVR